MKHKIGGWDEIKQMFRIALYQHSAASIFLIVKNMNSSCRRFYLLCRHPSNKKLLVPFANADNRILKGFSTSSLLISKKKLILPLKAVKVEPGSVFSNVGQELSQILKTSDIVKIINQFFVNKKIKDLAIEHGLDGRYQKVTRLG